MQFFKSFTAVFMAAVIVISVPFINRAASLTEVKEQQQALLLKEKETEDKINALTVTADNLSEYISLIEEELETNEEEASICQEQILGFTTSKEKEKEKLRDEVALVYTNDGAVKSLTNLVNKDAYELFFSTCKALSVLSEEDNTSLIILADNILVYEQLILDVNKELVRVDDKKLTLETLKTDAESELSDTENLAETERNNIDNLDSSLGNADDIINLWFEEYQKIQGTLGLVGNAYFIWPLPGYTSVTQLFGVDGHGGLDIAGSGCFGAPIVAADSGIVAFSGAMGTYGNLVIIDHQNGYLTYYAHQSLTAVDEGDWVEQGDVIGYVGSTGNSTGPHLHYEVWTGAGRTDPLTYY